MRKEWMDNYNLLLNYYKHYGDSMVPVKFCTKDGINESEDGLKLGEWLSRQRSEYSKLSFTQKKLLEKAEFYSKYTDYVWYKNYLRCVDYFNTFGDLDININYSIDGFNLGRWFKKQKNSFIDQTLEQEKIDLLNKLDKNWLHSTRTSFKVKYNLLLEYKKYYGDLAIPGTFRTFNGYEYDESGIQLGIWVLIVRNRKESLDKGFIKKLDDIGFIWDYNRYLLDKKYQELLNYYNEHKNIDIPINYVAPNGTKLGGWIQQQRQAYKNVGTCKINEEQIELLNKLGMKWDAINDAFVEKCNMVKEYIKHYGNNNIPYNFKTKDGVNYDENGQYIRSWYLSLSSKFNSLSKEHQELVLVLGINEIVSKWNRMYNLAKKYFEHYGNLEINSTFKTKDGINYDEEGFKLGVWINTQRKSFKGLLDRNIDSFNIDNLDDIGMVWLSNNLDKKLQSEVIDTSNIERKKKEITNRTYDVIYGLNDKEISTIDFNKEFIKKLERR